MKIKTISTLIMSLVFLLAGMTAEAVSVSDRILPLFENNVPHIIDFQTERQIELLLQDIMNRDNETEIRFIALPNRDITGTGERVSFATLRDNKLMSFGRDYLRSRTVFFIIWSVEEDIIFVSVPDTISDRISQTTVDYIIQSEYKDPVLRANVPLSTAIFNMLSHLGRYFSVAISVTPRYDQSLVPDGIPYPDFDIYTMPTEEVSRDEMPTTMTQETQFEESNVQTMPPPMPAGPMPQRSSSKLLTMLLILGAILVVAVVLITMMRKRSDTIDEDEFYDDEEDDDDDFFNEET